MESVEPTATEGIYQLSNLSNPQLWMDFIELEDAEEVYQLSMKFTELTALKGIYRPHRRQENLSPPDSPQRNLSNLLHSNGICRFKRTMPFHGGSTNHRYTNCK